MGILAHGIFALNGKAKLIAAGFILSVTAAGLLLFKHFKTDDAPVAPLQARQQRDEALRRLVGPTAMEDADNDGLKDWEEEIWRTDPAKADTDGDGATDGEEVLASRNPATAGPNDRLVASTDSSKEGAAAQGTELSTTEQFLSTILPDLLAATAAGKPPAVKELIERIGNSEFLANPAEALHGARQYTKADLTLAPKNDLAAIRTMFAAHASAMLTYLQPVAKEHDPVAAFFENPASPETQTNFAAFRTAFRAFVAAVWVAPVPTDYREYALAYLNTLSKFEHGFSLLANYEQDPLAAILAVRAFPAVQAEFAAVTEISQREARAIVEHTTQQTP